MGLLSTLSPLSIIIFREIWTLKQKVFRTTLFIIILLVLVYAVNWILKPRTFENIEAFYNLETNTVDALILGSSNAYSNINPAILWQEQGIASDILAGSAQPLWNTYYYMKEAYKYQKPSLIILEIYFAYLDAEYLDSANAVNNTLGLRLSRNKVEAIQASTQEKNLLSFLLGLPMYHSRYVELRTKKGDFIKHERQFGAIEKGFYPVFITNEQVRPASITTERVPIPPKAFKYLNMIIDLAKENNTPILLVKTPGIFDDHTQGIYNSVGDMAAQKNVLFLDLNQHYDGLGLDFGIDFVDGVHLNERGASKVSSYLGQYIKSHYGLFDRRGDKRYLTYENYSRLYEETQFKSPPIKSIQAVLLQQENIVVPPQNGELSVLPFIVPIKPNTYYQIKMKVFSRVDKQLVLVDLYGNGFDEAQQDKYFVLHKGENNVQDVFYCKNAILPPQVYLRFIARLRNDLRVDDFALYEVNVSD